MLMVEREPWGKGESVIVYAIANEEEPDFRVRERRQRAAES
jgi:hypothetical protein